jgi:hypothetical protein
MLSNVPYVSIDTSHNRNKANPVRGVDDNVIAVFINNSKPKFVYTGYAETLSSERLLVKLTKSHRYETSISIPITDHTNARYRVTSLIPISQLKGNRLATYEDVLHNGFTVLFKGLFDLEGYWMRDII